MFLATFAADWSCQWRHSEPRLPDVLPSFAPLLIVASSFPTRAGLQRDPSVTQPR